MTVWLILAWPFASAITALVWGRVITLADSRHQYAGDGEAQLPVTGRVQTHTHEKGI